MTAPAAGCERLATAPYLADRAGDIFHQCAAFLAQRFGVTHICRLRGEEGVADPAAAAAAAVVLLPDVRSLLDRPGAPAWGTLGGMLEHAPAAVLVRPFGVLRPLPGGERQRLVDGFSGALGARGLRVLFAGWARQERGLPALVAVLAGAGCPASGPAPPAFRVLALLSAYNEEDIIGPVLGHFARAGIGVYLIDNGSTDATAAIAHTYLGRGLVGMERFDPADPADLWLELMRRKEELAQVLAADWFINHDADELRESPWPELTLRDAFWLADRWGFTCVDFTVLEFPPVDDTFLPGSDPAAHFRHFLFDPNPHGTQVKAWKKPAARIAMAEHAGHRLVFPGARVFPFNFLVRHYPLRSQAHGERKIAERRARFGPERRKRGWHTQYDYVAPGASLHARAEDLALFTGSFHRDYLLERLTGLGFIPVNYCSVTEPLLAKWQQVEAAAARERGVSGGTGGAGGG